MRMLRCS